MSKGKAKIASKNNPSGRTKELDFFDESGRKIKPVKFINAVKGGNFIGAEYEDGALYKNALGEVIPWGEIDKRRIAAS